VQAVRGRPTLDGLTLEVPTGEAFGLAGRLGAGKTTTLRILATLVRPDEGTGTVVGVPVDGDPIEVRRMVGYLPERPGFYRRMTLREDLELHAGVHGVPRARRRSVSPDAFVPERVAVTSNGVPAVLEQVESVP